MRMLLIMNFPTERFNEAVRDGSVGAKLKKILDEQKPEAAYFGEVAGQRGVYLVVEIAKPSDLPRFSEPWFLTFDAEFQSTIAMTAEDVAAAGLEKLAKKYR